MPLAVQRLRLPDSGRVSSTVVGPDGLPVEPIEAFLAHLAAKGASPNTVAGYAYDLRDFFVWLDQQRLAFQRLTLEQLAQFFDWLRRPKPTRAPGVFLLPGGAPALEPSTLQRKRAAVASFYRFHARRDQTVPPLLGSCWDGEPPAPMCRCWSTPSDAASRSPTAQSGSPPAASRPRR